MGWAGLGMAWHGRLATISKVWVGGWVDWLRMMDGWWTWRMRNPDNARRILHQRARVLVSCWALELEAEEGMQVDEGSRDLVRGEGLSKGALLCYGQGRR